MPNPYSNENFIQIPNSILERTDIPSTAKLLFGVIYGFCRDGGTCRGSYSYLASRVGLSIMSSTVKDMVNVLIDKGLIVKVPTGRKNEKLLSLGGIPPGGTTPSVKTPDGKTAAHLAGERQQPGGKTPSDLAAGRQQINKEIKEIESGIYSASDASRRPAQPGDSYSLKDEENTEGQKPLPTIEDIKANYTAETLHIAVARNPLMKALHWPKSIDLNTSVNEYGAVPVLIELSHRIEEKGYDDTRPKRIQAFAEILEYGCVQT